MAKKTFEKDGQKRSTSLPREQVTLRAAGWAEVKPAKRAPKKIGTVAVSVAPKDVPEAKKPADDKPADSSKKTSK